ncbi:hypothetical protein V8F33_010569 [Rhypophila sp. PSN 637]
MTNDDTMTLQEAKHQAAAEVQIDWNEFRKLLPTTSKEPNTRLRRQSVQRPLYLVPLATRDSITLTAEELEQFAEPGPQHGHEYEDFMKLQPIQYEFTWTEVTDDIQAKMLDLAEQHISKPTKDDPNYSPSFPFTALCSDTIARDELTYCGNVDAIHWIKRMEEFPAEVWKEEKLRNFLIVSLYLTCAELHNVATTVNQNMKAMSNWAHHIQNLRNQDKEGVLPSTESGNDQSATAVDSLIEEIRERDKKIADLEAQILEVLQENRAISKKLADYGKGTTSGGQHTPPPVTTTQNPSMPNTPMSRVRFNLNLRDRNIASSRLTPTPGGASDAETTGNGTSKRSAKIEGPPTWDGDARSSKVSFEGWFRALENKLIVNKDHFHDENGMMSYVENRLSGDALDSLLPYLSDDHPDKISTLDELLAWLQTEYTDHTAKQKARKECEKLSMKPSDNLQEFKNEFVRLARKAKKPKSDWKEDFNDKITPQLRDQLTVAFVSDDVDFNTFVALALQYDVNNKQNYKRRQASRATVNSATGTTRSGTRPGSRPGGGSSSTPRASNGSVPAKPLAPAGPEEMKQLIKEGRCFNCRNQGHRTKECPDKASYRPRSTPMTEARIQEIIDRYSGGQKVEEVTDEQSGDDGPCQEN